MTTRTCLHIWKGFIFALTPTVLMYSCWYLYIEKSLVIWANIYRSAGLLQIRVFSVSVLPLFPYGNISIQRSLVSTLLFLLSHQSWHTGSLPSWLSNPHPIFDTSSSYTLIWTNIHPGIFFRFLTTSAVYKSIQCARTRQIAMGQQVNWVRTATQLLQTIQNLTFGFSNWTLKNAPIWDQREKKGTPWPWKF